RRSSDLARPERVDDDVGLLGEPKEDLAAFGRLEVECEVTLAALRVAEVGGVAGRFAPALERRPEPAGGLAFQALDPDHLGAMVGHGQADPRTRQEPGQIEHAKDRKSTRLNSSHVKISYAGFCFKKNN